MRQQVIFAALCLSLSPAGMINAHAKSYVPDVTLSPSWNDDSIFHSSNSTDNSGWWKRFGDSVLDTLIARGERANYDATTAMRRIDIARAELLGARSGYYPQIGISAGWERERTSGRIASRSGNAVTTDYFNASASVSWEIDLFGKVRAKAREAKANVNLSAAEYAGTMIALDAQIATTYINLQVQRLQLAVSREHAESQWHIVDIAETRHRTGLASKLDVAQARTLYYSTISSIPVLESDIEASYNALAVLLGTTVENLPSELTASSDLPSAENPLIYMGTPSDLLRRRPDIVAAEKSIDVAAAALGIAKSEYLPSLAITASAGTMAHNIGDLFSGPSYGYSIMPTLSWTAFDGFARKAATAEAALELQNAVDSYNLTVITAIEEVRNGVSAYKADMEYISRIEQVVENSRESVVLSLDQYKQGLCVFTNVVDAQLNYLTYQNTLVAARGEALNSLVTLYKALGGGWYE